MNYIIWKGVDSRSLIGLLIRELPSISKPIQRADLIEIEGKGGAICEKLGWRVYEKLLKIGLYGNFDLNQIIKYFSSEGRIIFSNEPDKYYSSGIFNEISYNRLIKFRTADIIFHTQPFNIL